MVIPGRNFNPFFALAEVIWILSGSGNVEWICYFNKNMRKFADGNQQDFNGAYGLRMRRWPSAIGGYLTVDQISIAIDKLKREPLSRQAVISLWDPERDNLLKSNDYPCNNVIYLRLRNGILDQTVVQRSCDLIWGAPYNAVQFSHIHAYIAGCLGAKIGKLTYIIQNLHYYEELYKPTLGNILERAFDESEVMNQASVKAECVPGFSTVTDEEFQHVLLKVEKIRAFKTDKPRELPNPTWPPPPDGYWIKTIPQMLTIFRWVKEPGWQYRAEWVASEILHLPSPFMELALNYYEQCTYGISKEVYSTCVRLLDDAKEKGRTNTEDKEGPGQESPREADNAIPS
jgi:thymidylate synthase